MALASKSTLYLATGNLGKLREFCLAAAAKGIRVEAIPHFSILPPSIEDGETFLENARKKALHYSKFTSGLVFADDSGICVNALGGAPGIYSARYSGPEATDASNNELLLRELKKSGAKDRGAHYVCVIVLARNKRVLGKFEGRAEGLISEAPNGSGGFGYDPYFWYPPLASTFAELSPAEKLKVSHRGKAFRRLLDFLYRRREPQD